MKRVMKVRVKHRNERHVAVAVYTGIDGEGDVPDQGYILVGNLTFDAAEWDAKWEIEFERFAEVES